MTINTQNQQVLDSAASVSYVNLAGVALSIALTIVFIALGAHAMKYLKTFAMKIKIIVNRADERNYKLYKDFNHERNLENLSAKTKKRSQKYLAMEQVFKTEIRRSRSPHLFYIFSCYMAKYDFLVYYPFRNRALTQIDMLKPKPSFFALLSITSLCIAWTATILLVALMQLKYSDPSTISISIFAVCTFVVTLVTSTLSLVAIERIFSLYLLNIKNAFKVDYGNSFVKVEEGGLNKYKPKDKQELENIKFYQEMFRGGQNFANNSVSKSQIQLGQSQRMNYSNSTLKTDMHLTSSRKLLFGEEYGISNRGIGFGNLRNVVIQEEDMEDENDPNGIGNYQNYRQTNDQHNMQYQQNYLSQKMSQYMKGKLAEHNVEKTKVLLDIYNLEQHVKGIDEHYINTEQKYLYIEDKHHIGDLDMLNNEATKGENKSNIITFTIMFAIICLASVFCCYLNYHFPSLLSQRAFYMFLIAFGADILALRPILIFLISFFKTCISRIKGYKTLNDGNKLLKSDINKAVRDMFIKTPKGANNNVNNSSFLNRSRISAGVNQSQMSKEEQNFNSFIQKLKSRGEIADEEYQTGHLFHQDFQNMSLKQNPFEENKEDDEAEELDNQFQTKRDDSPDNQKIAASNNKENSQLRPFDENKSFEKSQQQNYHTQMPLVANQIQTKEQQEDKDKIAEQQLGKQRKLANELCDYNLLLLRMIFDAYDDKGDKVLRQFRSDRHGILRKKFVTPMVNPNYDYDKLMKELEEEDVPEEQGQEEGQQDANEDQKGEDMNQNEGQTVQEEIALSEEEEKERKKKLREKERIDKFGNKVSNKKDEYASVTQKPEFGKIEMECQDEIEEEDADAWSKKMKELAILRAKKKSGQELTDQEEKRLVQLEKEEDLHRHNEIQNLERKLNRSEEENQLLQKLLEEEEDYRMRRMEDLFNKKKTKEGLTEEEQEELKMLEEWLIKKKLKMLEELRYKQKNGTLTDDEFKKLTELEDWEWTEFLSKELDELRKKLKDGTITDEERKRLAELEEMEAKRLKRELEMLRQKAKDGTLTEEEKLRLKELEEWEKRMMLKQLEKEENERLKQIELLLAEYRTKGEENLSDVERLDYLFLQKEKDEILVTKLKRKEDLQQEDYKEINDLEDDIERLDYEILLLKKKMGTITDEELERLRQLETKFKMNEMSEIQSQEDVLDKDMQNDIELLEEQAFGEGQNPFEQQNELNEQQMKFVQDKNKEMEEDEVTDNDRSSIVHSRITDQENFAELPPIELMNNMQKDKDEEEQDEEAQKQQQLLKQQHEQEISRQQQLLKQQQEEDIKRQQEELLRKQKEQQEIQEQEEQTKQQDIQKLKQKQVEEEQELERQKQLHEEQQKLKQQQLLEQQQELERQQQENLKKIEHEENDLKKQQLIQQEEQLRKQQELLEHQKELQRQQEELQRLLDQQKEEELLQQRTHQEELEKQLEQERLLRSQQQKRQQEEEQKQLQQQQEDQQQLLQKQLDEQKQQLQQQMDDQRQSMRSQLQQQRDKLESQQNALSQKSSIKKQNDGERLGTAKSNVRFQDQEDESMMNFEEQKMFGEGQGINSEDEQRQLTASRKSNKSKQHSQQQEDLEELDRDNLMSRGKPMTSDNDKDLEFGHDDLEMGGAPGGAQIEPEESIYSHKTSTILDEEKVSFMHIEHLPNQDNASEDSFSEQDMVYYNKDDMTNYSKGMGLNKVAAKKQPNNRQNFTPGKQQQQYYSENDIQEVQNDEEGDNESEYTVDENGKRVKRQRGPGGRGQLRHNQLETQSYDDDIDGRVKVDSWNLNYSKKKKKLKKRKIDQKTKDKMNDLQSIYGVDAKTLAGLQKGQLPKKNIGKGKGGDGDDQGQSRFGGTDMSFRSTQNTFFKQSKLNGLGGNSANRDKDNMMASKQSLDAQSNMFSFNGGKSMMSRGFNNKGNPMKGVPRGRQKMTETQKKFNKPDGGYLEEESKSHRGGSSNSGSLPRGLNSQSLKKGNKKGQNSKQKKKGGLKDYDSYSESDEGVDDQNAQFQQEDSELHSELFGYRNSRQNSNTNNGYNFNSQNNNNKKGQANKKKINNGGMNDDLEDHTESDEGVNQGQINFDDNDQNYIFKKRGFGESSNMRSQGVKNTSVKGNQQNTSSKRSLGGGFADDMEEEDLEAQDIKVTGKKRGNNYRSNKQNNQRGTDDESSNTGNIFNMHNMNQRRALNTQSDHSDVEAMQTSQTRFQGGQGQGQYSSQKPPLNNKRRDQNSIDSDNMRSNSNNRNNHSNNLNFNARNRQNISDVEDNVNHNNIKFNQVHMRNSSYSQEGRSQSKSNNKNRNNRQNDVDDDSYIVGPESNLSKLKNRQFGNRVNDGAMDDRYARVRGDREIGIESMDEDNNNTSNQFAKKRKIRRAAQSQHTRHDVYSKHAEKQRVDRLKKKQMEEEKLLVQREGGENSSLKKKKKLKKDMIKKEVNYWLDYDSPYAEYLVARFREWSPQVNVNNKLYNVDCLLQQPQSRASSTRQNKNKYNEVSNLYQNPGGRNSSSKLGQYNQDSVERDRKNSSSRSPNRPPLSNQKNSNQKKKNNNGQQQQQDSKNNTKYKSDNENSFNRPLQVNRQVNNLFATDFEEP